MTDKSVVIALLCFNEEKNLLRMLDEIKKLQSRWVFESEVVIFDNCSSDNTSVLCENYFREYLSMSGSVRRNEKNLGYSGNVFQSILYFKESKKDFLLIVDGDGQFPIHHAPEFLFHLESGNNLVLTKRKLTNQKFHRVVATFAFRILTAIILGTKMKDVNGGFRGIDRRFLDFVLGFHNGITANPLLYSVAKQNNLKISWVSMTPTERLSGESFLKFNKPLLLTYTSIVELLQIKKQKFYWRFHE